MTKHNNRRQAWKEFQKNFGQKLKQMRLEQGLKIDEAVPILIMGATYLKHLENGTFRDIKLSGLHALAYKYHYKINISFEKKEIT